MCRDHLEARPLENGRHSIELLASLVIRHLHLEKAWRTCRAAVHDTITEYITSFGDEDDCRIRAMCGRRCIHVNDKHVACEQPIDRGAKCVIATNEIAEPAPCGCGARLCNRSSTGISDDERGASGVLLLEKHERRDRGVNTANHDGISHVTQRRRDGGLRTMLHMKQ